MHDPIYDVWHVGPDADSQGNMNTYTYTSASQKGLVFVIILQIKYKHFIIQRSKVLIILIVYLVVLLSSLPFVSVFTLKTVQGKMLLQFTSYFCNLKLLSCSRSC